MKKSEVKAKSNLELIEYLILGASGYIVSKRTEGIAIEVCKELEKRDVITDARRLFSVWRG
mgnify:CR=1 FL=1